MDIYSRCLDIVVHKSRQVCGNLLTKKFESIKQRDWSLHGRLACELQNYFGRKAREAPPGLQETCARTPLANVQRRIRIYLHALWGRDFAIKPIAGNQDNKAPRQPFVEKSSIHAPSYFDDFVVDGVTVFTGLEVYRAAATHAAAHIVYSKQRFPDRLANDWQRAVVATIEDARVETLSIRNFPGLKLLWTTQHTVTPLHNQTAGDYLARLSRALLDEHYRDDDPWIARGRSMFLAADDLEKHNFSWDIGLELEHSFPNRKIKSDNLPGTAAPPTVTTTAISGNRPIRIP